MDVDAAALKLIPDGSDLLLQTPFEPLLLKVAVLQAWFSRDKELAATRDRALTAGRPTKDPRIAERVAKICSLSPADGRTQDAALLLARRAVELGKDDPYLPYFQMALGMAEYRSGHFPAADGALITATRLGGDNYVVSVTSAFYRAMSLFRQGNEMEARKVATDAVARMKPLPADEKNPLGVNDTSDDLVLWLACKEAKALLKFDLR
jgi:hypothetical protein